MICHVCQASASGQCRACLKFYCPAHGDGLCAPCAADPTAPEVRAAAPPVCFRCPALAVDTCDDCGKSFCNRHGAAEPQTVLSDRRLRCAECQESAQNFGCLIAALILIPTFIAVSVFLSRGPGGIPR